VFFFLFVFFLLCSYGAKEEKEAKQKRKGFVFLAPPSFLAKPKKTRDIL
jgi:hypothetical protein